MSTLTVTVKQHDGTTNQQYVLVRAYNTGYTGQASDTYVAGGETNSSGVVALTVPDGTYILHFEPTADRTYVPQWLGPHTFGVLEMDQAKVVTVSGATAVTMNLETTQHLYGTDADVQFDTVPWSWWVDTTNADAILRLLPGEERRPFNGDKLDPLYKHVLLGPFTTRAKAVTAAAS